MARVVSVVETLGAQGHARGDATGPASVRHEIGRPDQAAQGRVVVGPDGFAELLEAFAWCDETFAPVESLGVRRWGFGIQHNVEQLLELSYPVAIVSPIQVCLQVGGGGFLVPAKQRRRHHAL